MSLALTVSLQQTFFMAAKSALLQVNGQEE
jgi:hypothetical protein